MDEPPPPDVLPHLTEPSDAEAARYYEWLPSRPVLLGRSSSGLRHWGPDTAVYRAGGYAGDEGKPRRSMWVGPVGDHPLRDVWPLQEFRQMLKHALATLGGIDFHAITPARLGLQQQIKKQKVPPRRVTLLVGVSSEAAAGLAWPTIAWALRLTHGLLQSHGLGDVECELRKTEHVLAGDVDAVNVDADTVNVGGPFILPSRGFRRMRQDEDEIKIERALSPWIGNGISPKGRPTQEGTLGLFLGPADGTGTRTADEPVWALTCRHVAYLKEKADNDDNDDNDDTPSIIMPADTGLKTAIETAERMATTLQEMVDGVHGYVDPADPATIVDQMKLEWAKDMRDRLVALQKSDDDRTNRVIGRVACSPSIGVKGNDRNQPGQFQSKYMRDYALVKLDRRKFPDGFDFHNVAALDRGTYASNIIGTVNAVLEDSKTAFSTPSDGLLRLSGTIPLAEIKDDRKDGERLVLVKDGRTSGLTAGIALDLETYHRTYAGGIEVDSLEWTLVHISFARYDKYRPLENVFAAEGDSGAVVFDLDGRVGGMLTSGTGMFALDTTYVTPMAYLLEDIERELGFPVRVL